MSAGDTVHLILCTWCIYWYLVSNFGNYPTLGIPHWSMSLQTDANWIVGCGVQMFFARRVLQITRQKFLTAVIIVLSTIHGSLGIYFTVEAFVLKSFAKYKSLTWVTCVGLGSAALADILIAVSLCYFLHKSRTGFARTDTLISTLMMYAINTATLSVICFAVMSNTFVWMSFFWSLGRCTIFTSVALNSREAMRETVNASNGTFLPLSHTRSDCSNAYRYPTDDRKVNLFRGLIARTLINDNLVQQPTRDIEAQSPSSSKDYSNPNSPAHTRLTFLPSPPPPRA
ncbi:hypothetical protein BD410DRAFT_789039 [Rickenella mellea]|uniref:DUF6534 domain-containing protein n=1 Tax=Rickenella mellea TaxID=50990 RepID=A0A4Y7Q3D5_9AGAM|nr:hypothetical protein BD410DRAFT_789039 [Rickenella mellea]